jgi:hypothetical protein
MSADSTFHAIAEAARTAIWVTSGEHANSALDLKQLKDLRIIL